MSGRSPGFDVGGREKDGDQPRAVNPPTTGDQNAERLCFEDSGVEDVSIPDGVYELGSCCFKGCKNLLRVTFGPSSSLVRISCSCFFHAGVEEVSIPGVYDLGSCILHIIFSGVKWSFDFSYGLYIYI